MNSFFFGFLVLLPLVATQFFAPSLAAGTTRPPLAWPRQVASPIGEVTVYQPLVDRYADGRLFGIAALSLRRPSGGGELHGAFWFSCRVVVDRDLHQSVLGDYRMETVNLFAAAPDELSTLADSLAGILPQAPQTLPLDSTLAAIESVAQGNVELVEIRRSPSPQNEPPAAEKAPPPASEPLLATDDDGGQNKSERMDDQPTGQFIPAPVVLWDSPSRPLRVSWHTAPDVYHPTGFHHPRHPSIHWRRGTVATRGTRRPETGPKPAPPATPAPQRPTSRVRIMLGDQQRENLARSMARFRDVAAD